MGSKRAERLHAFAVCTQGTRAERACEGSKQFRGAAAWPAQTSGRRCNHNNGPRRSRRAARRVTNDGCHTVLRGTSAQEEDVMLIEREGDVLGEETCAQGEAARGSRKSSRFGGTTSSWTPTSKRCGTRWTPLREATVGFERELRTSRYQRSAVRWLRGPRRSCARQMVCRGER